MRPIWAPQTLLVSFSGRYKTWGLVDGSTARDLSAWALAGSLVLQAGLGGQKLPALLPGASLPC